ncbi:MAG: hypothetical protein LBB11_00535, partial [Puniceicoccales bacterium]|nr:hypothetical protein [Puniceicoccales bacterium]
MGFHILYTPMASIKPYIVATIIAGNFPNVFHASEQRQSQEDISKTNTSALGTDVNLGDTVHSKAKTFLSKINATCALEAKLGLRLLLNRTGQSLSEMEIWTTIDHYSTQYRNEKLQTDPLPVVLLEITDGRFICPYFFNELSIDDSWPNGRKIIYKSGIFNDDNIQNILRQRNLGKNGVLIKNWVNLWSQGKLLFFITYNKKLFCLVPESEANKLIDIKLKAWYTSSTKKAVFVLAGTTVIVAAASVVKTLMGPKLNILPQPRSLPITAATEPSVAMNVASFRDYSSPASDGHSKYNFDYRVFKDHRTFQDEHRQVIFAGATHLSYRCYDYANRTISLKKYQKNYFKAMLDLKYDLDVAENQCNWAAKEIIARELLEIIGGKYGSTEAYAQGNTSEMQAMIDYQDMVTLHAATAALEMAIQRKSMEICKSHLKLTDEDLCKVYADNSRCSMALDTPLEEYLKKLNMVLPGSFEIDEPLLLGTPRVKDIIALAKLLCNPKLLEVALSTIAYPDIIHNHAPQDRSLYIKAITHLIDTYFKIPPGKEFLKKIATNYFIKIYDRIEHFLEFAKPQVKLKLRDCNGKDIFGNKNVCSYNATLELIRREPTNKNFIATGGM